MRFKNISQSDYTHHLVVNTFLGHIVAVTEIYVVSILIMAIVKIFTVMIYLYVYTLSYSYTFILLII